MTASIAPTSAHRAPRAASGMTPIDAAIGAYLALPLLIFCSWFRWPVALALAVLVLYAMSQLFAGTRWRERSVAPAWLGAIFVVTLGWTALAGIGHFFYANIDWATRDAVLRDLTATAWPPSYESGPQFALILRAPVGYYLPAAIVGWLTNPRAGDIALYLWSALGLTLFLAGATTLFATARQRVVACVMLIAFSGLDLVGWFLVSGGLPQPGQHIEWWARFAQYSSNPTLWFWVPNHALPAWLGTVLALRHWREPALARLGPLMAAVVPLWSPLAAIGLAPFFIAGIDWRRDGRALLDVRASLPLFAVALLAARYLTLDADTIPGAWAFANEPLGEFMTIYLPFCLVEFALLAYVLFRLGVRDLPFLLAVAILTALPLYRFGAANDLAMRSSIPALAVLALATVRPLAAPARSGWWAALLGLVLLGTLGAGQEPLRALITKPWAMTGLTLRQVQQVGMENVPVPLPTNYVAHLNQPGLAALLRPPAPVVPYAARAPRTLP